MIGVDADEVHQAVLEIVELDGVTIELSNRSSRGTYVSFNVEVTVTSEEERIGLYEALKDHDKVRMVL